jgi:hypothetical protein
MHADRLSKLIEQAASVVCSPSHIIFESIKLSVFKMSQEEIAKWNIRHKNQIKTNGGIRTIIVSGHTLSINMLVNEVILCLYCNSKNIHVSESEVECLDCQQAWAIDPSAQRCASTCAF